MNHIDQYLDELTQDVAHNRLGAKTLELTGYCLRGYEAYIFVYTDGGIEDSTKQTIYDYFADRSDLSANSKSTYLAILKAFFKWMDANIDDGVTPDDLRDALRRHKQYKNILLIRREDYKVDEVSAFTLDELAGILTASHPNPMHHGLMYLLAYFGMRKAALLDLQIENINIGEQYITRPDTVGSHKNMPAKLYFDDRTLEVIETLIDGRDAGYLVFGNNPNCRMSDSTPNTICRRYGGLLGIDINPHRFRHTFNTHMRRALNDDLLLKRLMGHSIKGDMTGVYDTEIDEEIRHAMVELHYMRDLDW